MNYDMSFWWPDVPWTRLPAITLSESDVFLLFYQSIYSCLSKHSRYKSRDSDSFRNNLSCFCGMFHFYRSWQGILPTVQGGRDNKVYTRLHIKAPAAYPRCLEWLLNHGSSMVTAVRNNPQILFWKHSLNVPHRFCWWQWYFIRVKLDRIFDNLYRIGILEYFCGIMKSSIFRRPEIEFHVSLP